MARMVPFPMLETESSAERLLYESFMEQLSDEYVIFHSVDWVLAGRDGTAEQGEADFVIAHPVDGLLVMEVKGGELRYDPTRRRWSQGGRSGSHDLDKDPFKQASGEMRSLVKILEAKPGWLDWRPSFGYAVAFPQSMYEREAHPGAPLDLVLDRDDLDRLPRRVAEIQQHWVRDGRAFGERGMRELERALGYAVEVRTPMKRMFREEDRKIVELTQEQAYARAFVLNRSRAVVSGPPGSGKTVLAMSVARHIAEGGRRTLLTCFNKRLAAHLSECTEGVPHLEVAHFHGLCTSLAREAGLKVPTDPGEDQRAFFDETLPGLLEEAGRKLGPRFDAMVVDEAQDFREWWWPALLSLHRDPDRGALYLFADESQNLYDGGQLPVDADTGSLLLHENLRNTKAIGEFVSVFFDAGQLPGAPKGPPGRDVEVLDYSGEDELFRLVEVVLKNLIEQEQLSLDDIVILTPAGREKSILWEKRQIGKFTLSDAVEPDTVLWSTVHSFKGLERAVVILAEMGERHADDVDRFIRVGCSRARNHLIVLATQPVASEIRRRARVS